MTIKIKIFLKGTNMLNNNIFLNFHFKPNEHKEKISMLSIYLIYILILKENVKNL